MFPAALAAVLVVSGHLMGWTGVDTAAQVYRVDSFRQSGFSLWDFRWYGGHWTPDYSILYPPVAGVVGMLTVTVLSAALATLAFDRLARAPLGGGGWSAAYLFAAGTLVPASIGQLTFLAGAAVGLAGLWAASRGRWVVTLPLALTCTLTSPLAGAFLGLAGVVWTARRALARDRGQAGWAGGMAALAVAPILAAAVLFPGDGPMPYPVTDWLWEMAVASAVAVLAGRRHALICTGAAMYMLAATLSEVVASPLGGNVGRLEDLVALPLVAGLAWTRLPLIVPLASVPLALSQWAPAWGAFTDAPGQASTHRSFYAPLDAALLRQSRGGPAGRVEVVPTQWHWESAFVAPVMPLARGWERQLDEADNALFYGSGVLGAPAYRAWLLHNGVRFVALPAAPMDMAGRAEAALISSGRVPGLDLVWRSGSWRLYEVSGSPGIVSGPAQLVSTGQGRIDLEARRPGDITVRIRWSPDWYVAGHAGCVVRDRDWMSVHASRPGPLQLRMSLTAVFDPDRGACPTMTAVSSARE